MTILRYSSAKVLSHGRVRRDGDRFGDEGFGGIGHEVKNACGVEAFVPLLMNDDKDEDDEDENGNKHDNDDGHDDDDEEDGGDARCVALYTHPWSCTWRR